MNATARKNATTGGMFNLPHSEPIHLEGEADAYAGETFENAYHRLHDAGCQCGFIVDRETNEHGHFVYVYQTTRAFRLTFSHMSMKLVRVESRHFEADPWKEWAKF